MAINSAFRSRQNLFQPPDDDQVQVQGTFPESTNPSPVQPKPGLADIYNQISSMQSGPASKNYKAFLDTQPNREDFKPGRSQKIGAVLAGIGEGSKNGAARGMEARNEALDKPYNNAMADFKIKGDRLAKGADLEEKDINNRVKTYRDFLGDKDKADALAETRDYHQGTLAVKNREAANNEKKLSTQGWNFTTRSLDGHRIGTKIDANSPNGYNTIDLGKIEETPDEKSARGNKDFQFRSGVTGSRMKNLFEFEEPKRVADQKDIIDYKQGYALDKEERTRMEKDAKTDKQSPQKDFAIRALALRNVLDDNPEMAKKGWFGSDAAINLKTMTWKPEVDKLVQAEISKLNSRYTTKPATIKSNIKTNIGGKNDDKPRVTVYDKEGKPFLLPAEQLEQAKAQGYSDVKPKGK